MYAPAVNSGTPARKITAARTRFGGDTDDDRVDYPATNEQIPEWWPRTSRAWILPGITVNTNPAGRITIQADADNALQVSPGNDLGRSSVAKSMAGDRLGNVGQQVC